MAVIMALLRWAIMRARRPDPVPTSSTLPVAGASAHAPSKTESVPTFMEQSASFTENCLKKKDMQMIVMKVIEIPASTIAIVRKLRLQM
jgi:hypothetical protein